MFQRVKLIALSPSDVMQCFRNTDKVVRKISFVGLPADAKYLNPNYDYARQCWTILVEHPSFPELKLGEMPEMLVKQTAIVNYSVQPAVQMGWQITQDSMIKGIYVSTEDGKTYNIGEGPAYNPFEKTWRDKEPML